MAESIGLIERAAALLRQRDADETDPLPLPPAGEVDAGNGSPELVLDRGRLASYGITMPSSARSRTIEEFRLVKRNLMAQFSQGDSSADQRSSRLIMVTSARPGEGKTFISLNLALAFASERDVKALLVDIDTQHSTWQTILGISTEQGIVDVLAGARELSEVLIQTNIPNLMVLPSGRGGPHVPELFSSNKMANLMAEMTRRFADRYIIIDTPPCMASTDAAALAPLVGQIVFIVEAHHTQEVEIEASLSMLSACPRISLLLNKSDRANILAPTSIIIIPKVVRPMPDARTSLHNFTAAHAFLILFVVLLVGVTQTAPAAAQGGTPAAGGGPPGAGPETPAAAGGPPAIQPAPVGGGPDILPLVPGGGFGFPNPLNPPAAINNAAAPAAPFSPFGLTPLGFGVVPLQANDPNAPAYLIRPYASIAETFTDNVHYAHSPRDAAAYTNLAPGVSFSADTPRLQAVLTGNLNTAFYIPSSSNLNQVYGSLYANGFGTIVPDALFVNLNSVVTQSTTLPGLGFQNLSRLPTNQQTQVYSTTVSPFLRKSFDGLVDSELRYTFNSTNFGGNTTVLTSPLGTPTTLASATFNEGTFIASTGQDFSRTLSRLTLDASNYNSGTTNQNSQVSAFNDLEYRITPQIAALGRVGYQNIQYPFAPAATFVGPTWLIGGAIGSYAIGGYGSGPGYFALQYGRQQGVCGFTGSAQYNITPTMAFNASLIQGISGQTQYLASTIATSTLDPYGSIADQYTGLPTAFYSPGLGLTNNVYRQHLLNFGSTEAIERNRYSLYGSVSNYQSLTPPVTAPTKSYGINLSWYRDIRPDLGGYATIGYYNSTNVIAVTGGTPVSNLNTISAYLGINYSFAQNLTGSILYSLSYQPNGIGGTVGRGADIVVNQLTFSLNKA